jgi:hypothetical protein
MFEPRRAGPSRLVSFRVGPDEDRALAMLARERGLSVSDVIRDALSRLIGAPNRPPPDDPNGAPDGPHSDD